MSWFNAAKPLDETGVRFRLASVRVGIAMTIFGVIGTVIYGLFTWEQPNRTPLLFVSALALASVPLLVALPLERIIQSRWREAAFVGWSAGIIVVCLSAAALDGGTESPLAVLLLTPLMFAALTYSSPGVIAVGILDLLAFGGLALADHANASISGFVVFVLVVVAVASFWQARNRERQADRLRETANALAESEASDRKRALQQEEVAAFGIRALGGSPIERLMQDASSTLQRAIDVDHAAVLELQGDGEFLLRAAAGLPSEAVGRKRVAGGRGSQSGFTLESNEPVIVEDWSTEERFARPGAPDPPQVSSGVAVPIKAKGAAFGVLVCSSITRREFGPDDVNFLQSIANGLANAIERRNEEEKAHHRALHDPLTGLPNRTLFEDRLAHALTEQERRGTNVAVLFLDLDHFKLVNDSLGHPFGDLLLKAVAPRLKQALRPGDTVARFGGDEFGILLDDVADERDAAVVAEKLIAALAGPFVLGGSQHFATVSIGIAVGGAGDRPNALIRDSDAAMYRAKERGRARYEIFDDEMRIRVGERLRIENELRSAIERDEFRVHYQPIVSLSTGRISSAEALVRWDHPDRGLIGPERFIGIAEETGLIVPIGRKVLDESCHADAAWQACDPDASPVRLAVNVSMRQLTDPDIVENVRRCLDASGVQPTCLSLELTEGALLEETESVYASLRELKELGVLLALDDFGTGYSSLGHLKRLPFDIIKLDRSFVQTLGEGATDKGIVTAVVALAQTLDLNVVAEGVENAEQLAIVRALGCHYAQGHHFSPPVEADDFGRLLEAGELVSFDSAPA